jgi:uncharacterized protein involved in copper resistance
MKLLRYLSLAHARALLAFVLAALAMQAIVPAGLMVVPATGHGAQIILCPQTHPLARALTARSDADADAGMDALHAAMGHGDMGHASMDHAATGQSDAADDPAPASSAAPASQSCAFSGAGALAAMLPGHSESVSALALAPDLPPAMLVELRLAHPPRLRPPLRAPPVLI